MLSKEDKVYIEEAILNALHSKNRMIDEDPQRVDDRTGTGITYVGYCEQPCLSTDAKWKIKRITQVSSGGSVESIIEYAGANAGTNPGTRKYDQVWSNRLTLTYK